MFIVKTKAQVSMTVFLDSRSNGIAWALMLEIQTVEASTWTCKVCEAVSVFNFGGNPFPLGPV